MPNLLDITCFTFACEMPVAALAPESLLRVNKKGALPLNNRGLSNQL